MEMKRAVITGSSSGFGLHTSIELAKQGFQVIATMRDLKKGTQLMNLAEEQGLNDRIQLYELDVTLEESIQSWKSFMEELGSVEVLVNNAGYAGAGFAEEIPIDEFRKQFETNVFGVIAVTQAILPLMRNQGSGKIINISSISGKIGFPGLSPYVASKHALEGFSESLRLELQSFGIDVVLVQPGSFQTNIWSTGKQVAAKSQDRESPYYEMMEKLEQHLEKGTKRYGDPTHVAKLIADIAQKKRTRLRYFIGRGVKQTIALKTMLPWRIWERLLYKQLK